MARSHLDPALGGTGRPDWSSIALALAVFAGGRRRPSGARRCGFRGVPGRLVASPRAPRPGLSGLGGRRHRLHVVPGDGATSRPDETIFPARLEGGRRDDLATTRAVPGRRSAAFPAADRDGPVHRPDRIHHGFGKILPRTTHGVAERVHGRHGPGGQPARGRDSTVRGRLYCGNIRGARGPAGPRGDLPGRGECRELCPGHADRAARPQPALAGGRHAGDRDAGGDLHRASGRRHPRQRRAVGIRHRGGYHEYRLTTGELQQGALPARPGYQPVPDPYRRTHAELPRRPVRDRMGGGREPEGQGASGGDLSGARPDWSALRSAEPRRTQMKAFRIVAVLALATLALGTWVPPAHAQGTPAQPQLQTQTAAIPLYKPPLLGAPGGRVGGGTRGPARDMFVLSALAPNHTGTSAT